jgi:hypothetical protein
MTLEDYFFTKNTRYFIWGAAGIVFVLLAAHAAVAVTSHKDDSRGHRPGKMFYSIVPVPGEAYIEGGHGAIGTINNIALPHFMLVTRGGMSQKVYAATGTMVTFGAGVATTTDALQNGFVVMVIGEPRYDEKYIEARIIRVLPPPPQK